jgi:ubiquinone biosynthesis protein UbiJ
MKRTSKITATALAVLAVTLAAFGGITGVATSDTGPSAIQLQGEINQALDNAAAAEGHAFAGIHELEQKFEKFLATEYRMQVPDQELYTQTERLKEEDAELRHQVSTLAKAVRRLEHRHR